MKVNNLVQSFLCSLCCFNIEFNSILYVFGPCDIGSSHQVMSWGASKVGRVAQYINSTEGLLYSAARTVTLPKFNIAPEK